MPDTGVNVKEQVTNEKLSDDLKEFIEKLRKNVDNDRNNRAGWLRKITASFNQRSGIKKITNLPYPGAPNIPLPEADKIIIKNKPNFILSAYTQRKKALVRVAEGVRETDELKEKRKRAELGLNFVLNNKNNLFHILDLASDNFLEKGHAIFKVIEDFKKVKIHRVIELEKYPVDTIQQLKQYSNEELRLFIGQREGLDPEDDEDREVLDDIIEQFRNGEDEIHFDIDKIESWPKIIVVPPENIIPPSYAKCIEDAERLTEEFYLTKRELVERANNGMYDKEIVNKIEKMDFSGKGRSYDNDGVLEANQEIEEGVVNESNDELFKIQDVYTWYKPEGSKYYERWLFTFLADIGNTDENLLRKIPYPYELTTWNFVKHDNETRSDRWFSSRGDPERIRFLQQFMEKSMNNSIIRDEINNAPVYTVLSSSKLQANSVRFIPGQKVKVANHDEIRRIDDRQIVDASSHNIFTTLKATAEEYLSSTDQLFRNATNKGGGKTLGEVKIGVAAASAPTNVDVLRWFISLQKLYTMVFDILKERLGDSIVVEGQEITAEDFNFEATIVPNGSIDLVDNEFRLQKMTNRLNLIMQGPPEFVTTEDKYNAVRDWLEADGVQDPDRYTTDPKMIQQAETMNMLEEDQILAQQEGQLNQEINQLRGGLGRREQLAQQMAGV